jgi:hypothetical protein
MALGKALEKLRRDVLREMNRQAYQRARNAALQVVNDLQIDGPYWDGLFYNAWEVRAGDVNIPADLQGYPSRGQRADSAEQHPKVGAFRLEDIPDQRVDYRKVPSLTIGNRMEYRDVAMDLVPDSKGVFRGDKPRRTADRDWYTNYVNSVMPSRVARALKQNINLSS